MKDFEYMKENNQQLQLNLNIKIKELKNLAENNQKLQKYLNAKTKDFNDGKENNQKDQKVLLCLKVEVVDIIGVVIIAIIVLLCLKLGVVIFLRRNATEINDKECESHIIDKNVVQGVDSTSTTLDDPIWQILNLLDYT